MNTCYTPLQLHHFIKKHNHFHNSKIHLFITLIPETCHINVDNLITPCTFREGGEQQNHISNHQIWHAVLQAPNHLTYAMKAERHLSISQTHQGTKRGIKYNYRTAFQTICMLANSKSIDTMSSGHISEQARTADPQKPMLCHFYLLPIYAEL